MGSASQNSPKIDTEFNILKKQPGERRDTRLDIITLVLQKIKNTSEILVLGWFCINKKIQSFTFIFTKQIHILIINFL